MCYEWTSVLSLKYDSLHTSRMECPHSKKPGQAGILAPSGKPTDLAAENVSYKIRSQCSCLSLGLACLGRTTVQTILSSIECWKVAVCIYLPMILRLPSPLRWHKTRRFLWCSNPKFQLSMLAWA